MIQTNLQSTIRSLVTLFTAIRICHTDCNQQIEIFWTYNAQLSFHEKCLMLGLTGGSGKLKKTVKRMISRNMRNRDADLMQHINKHTKQGAMELPDL